MSPIPTPRKEEKEDEFIGRCMIDDIMQKEYPDSKQRTAVCYSSWKKKNLNKISIFGDI